MNKRKLSEFEKAFAKARKAGAQEFDYYGKKYHTRMKGESPDLWRIKMNAAAAGPIIGDEENLIKYVVKPEAPKPTRRKAR